MVGEKEHGFSIMKSKSEYNLLNNRAATCIVELSNQDAEQSDYAQIGPANMFFRIMFWVAFASCNNFEDHFVVAKKDGSFDSSWKDVNL